MRGTCVTSLILLMLMTALAPAAAAAEPRLTVPGWRMADALICYGPVGDGAPQPILFAPGTGSDGSQAFLLGGGAFAAMRRTLCAVSFPRRATADLQDSVQYLVFAIRRLASRAKRPIAVAGISQGGLLIRMALTYWPSLRARVTDAVTAAATHHGAPGTAETRTACLTAGCPPALWQQRRGSALLRALNKGRNETPGRTPYTTVRSATDEIVRPQTGPRPTSALEGAANILIQDVCPGRTTTHLGTVVDSVTIAALADAVTHPGPARISRLPADVCEHPYGTGLDEERTSAFLRYAPLLGSRGTDLPVVRAEPSVRAWMKRRAARRRARGAAFGDLRAIAENGFGDPRNSYAWSMAWFNGNLYVGTARSAMCVENATIDFYVPSAGYYRSHPAPGISCPPSIFQADLRAEIWRYSPQSGRWARVYRSPRLPNPRAPGRPIARDIGYRGMTVLRERGRPPALYVAALSPGEFVPELRRRHPPRILRTTDGETFRPLRARPGVIRTHLGPQRPIGFRAMAALGGSLYVTAGGGLTGDGVVLRVADPGSGSPRFEQVSPSSMAVFELATFRRRLYAGTGDFDAGYGVWRMGARSPQRWEPVLTGGAGRGQKITSVVSMAGYRGRLYVGASGWGGAVLPASELIRLAPDGSWDLVVGNPRRDAAGTLKAPVSGLPDGFGNVFNNHFWRMHAFRGALLLGTNDWSWSLAGVPALGDQLREELGFDLYGTCDGSDWWLATRDAFGRGGEDFGVRTMASSRAGLFIGTTNHVRGATIYRTRTAPCEPGARIDSVRPVHGATRLSRRDAASLKRALAAWKKRHRRPPVGGNAYPIGGM